MSVVTLKATAKSTIMMDKSVHRTAVSCLNVGELWNQRTMAKGEAPKSARGGATQVVAENGEAQGDIWIKSKPIFSGN